MRWPARPARRTLASSGIGRSARLTRSSARVETLLTFWPPGPELRVKEKVSADSGTETFGASMMPGGTADMVDRWRDVRGERCDLGLSGLSVASRLLPASEPAR